MEKQSLSHDVPPTNKQDVTRQSQELISKYGGQYLSKKFIYYKSGTRMTVKQNFRYAKMVLTHHHIRDFKDFKKKLSSFALFLEVATSTILISVLIILNYIHYFLIARLTTWFEQCFSIASSFASMELNLIQERLNSGRMNYSPLKWIFSYLEEKKGFNKDPHKLMAELR
jgi:hypothetical protein